MDEIDQTLIRHIIAQDPRYENVFSSLWLLVEKLGWRGNLQDVGDVLRSFYKKQLADMCAAWETASGRPMTKKQEQLCFENPKIKTSLTIIEKSIEFIERMYKADQIAALFGLEQVAPIAISKQVNGWSRGGKKTAEGNKLRVTKLKETILKAYAEMKKRNSKLSNNAIDEKVAADHNVSPTYVYKIRNPKKKF